jgi:hypothetical protein
VTLAGLAEGAAEEKFQDALSRVLLNIDDPNTKPDAVRQITLLVSFKPDDSRRKSAVLVECKTKLAHSRPAGAMIALGYHKGVLSAVEPMKQEELFPTPTARPQAVPAAAEEVAS